jgi:hypothetical protein
LSQQRIARGAAEHAPAQGTSRGDFSRNRARFAGSLAFASLLQAMPSSSASHGMDFTLDGLEGFVIHDKVFVFLWKVRGHGRPGQSGPRLKGEKALARLELSRSACRGSHGVSRAASVPRRLLVSSHVWWFALLAVLPFRLHFRQGAPHAFIPQDPPSASTLFHRSLHVCTCACGVLYGVLRAA